MSRFVGNHLVMSHFNDLVINYLACSVLSNQEDRPTAPKEISYRISGALYDESIVFSVTLSMGNVYFNDSVNKGFNRSIYLLDLQPYKIVNQYLATGIGLTLTYYPGGIGISINSWSPTNNRSFKYTNFRYDYFKRKYENV